MKKIFVKGTSVNLVSENGPYVILIHGLGLNKDMWEWQTRDLSKDYSLITYDLIGHGESKDPEQNLNLEIFSDQIFEIIEYFSLDKIALVGFSLGGMIARKFALKYNDLTFVSTNKFLKFIYSSNINSVIIVINKQKYKIN